MTEKQVLDLLRRRFCKPGNGGSGEYAFMVHVRNAAAFNANRTFDAITLSLWPSRGLELHAYEVKCSRSDWLRELKEPAKAEAAAQLVDRFWVVVSEASIVREGELPETWGLMVVKGTTQLQCVKQAPLLPDADSTRPISRSFLVALLRAGGAVPQADPEDVIAALNRGRLEGRAAADKEHEARGAAFDELRAKVKAFEDEAGVTITSWRGNDPAEVGRQLRAVIAGDKHSKRAVQEVERARDRLREAADDLDVLLSNEHGVPV